MRAKHQHERVLHTKGANPIENMKKKNKNMKSLHLTDDRLMFKNEVKNSGIICNLNNEIKCRIFYRSLIVWPRTA